MNFSEIANIVIPAGEVFSIHSGGTLLWSKPSPGPEPSVLPPDNEIWYEATYQMPDNKFGAGTIVSHTWDSETGKGIVTYDSAVINAGALVSNESGLIKLWFPNSLQGIGNGIKSNSNLEEIYFGSSFYSKHTDAIGGNSKLRLVKCYNNPYWEDNETALVSTAQHPLVAFQTPTLVTGTNRTDLRNSACQIIGARCICDVNLTGRTLYFGSTITNFTGDYNMGTNSSVYTMYWYSTTAPTLSDSWMRRYCIRCSSGTTVHIPVGSLASYQSTWADLSSYGNMTFVEDL